MPDSFAEDSKGTKGVLGLVQYCQRVLVANVDAISGFGEERRIPHRLIGPILQGCNADTLLRLEQDTPFLREHTSGLWKDLCSRDHPRAAELLLDSTIEDLGSWRDRYLHLKEKEAVRLEEAASKIRNQRLKAEELKRRHQIKITDRLPTTKRPRHGWSASASPQTLFEKTRREATKFQKNVFGARLGPTGTAKNSEGLHGGPVDSHASLTSKGTGIVKTTVVTVPSSCSKPGPTSPQMGCKRRPGHS
ncbi:hypothetical protein M0805_005957 [Coniferiporia weirii]|nr:hypothetical protein M0805_005957 [Coniferiporia weirii]